MRPSTRVCSPAVMLLALAAIACLDTAAPTMDQPRSVAAVRVQPAQVSVHLEERVSLSALTLDPAGEQVSGRPVVWSSEDTAIATVSPTGEVIPRRLGATTIVATADSKSGTAAITVVPPAVATVDLSPARATIAEGDTVQLTAVPRSRSGDSLSGRAITWSTGDAGVATVSSSGRVSGAHTGSTTITATSEGVSATSAVTVVVPSVASIVIAPTSVSILPGQSSQLTATAKDARGSALADRTISWSSTSTSIATVSASGLVRGVAEGSATIVATSEGKKDSVRVSVSRAPVASVTVTPTAATIEAGQSAQLTATPEDNAGKTLVGRIVSWTTSNAAVATVSSSGLVTGVAAGSATITATSEGQSGTAAVSVVVTAPAVASVSVTPAADSVLVAATAQLQATPEDASGGALSGRTITWSSSNTAVATVSSTGLVHGVAAGRATISATSEGKSGSANVLVMLPPVASVDVSPSSASVTVGSTVRLSATTRDASGATLTGRTIAWTTSASSVATVSSSGVVTGAAVGTATIYATSEGVSDSASIAVTVAPVATVTVSPASASLAPGGTQQLAATTRDAAGQTLTGRTITWSSSNSSVAAVSSSGLVTAVAAGSATITATSEGKSGTASIAVTAPPPPPPPPTETHAGWYVSPSGSGGNDGSASRPWDLATAFDGAGGKIQPGDTVWLRGGTYKGAFTSSLSGTSTQPIIVRQYPGERATIDGHMVALGSYTWYWGFEVTTSETAPGNVMGVNIGGPGVKAINMVSHDNGGNGFGVWEQAPDAEVYGSIVYNNGRQRVTSGYAHGIYTQNSTGTKLFQDDIVFHQFAYGIHAYAESGALTHMRFDGNVSFDNGVGTTDVSKAQPDFFFGGMTPLQDFTITSNMTWHVGYGGGSVWVGYESCGCTGTQIVLRDNYFVGGGPVLRLQDLSGVTVAGNTLVGPGDVASMIEERGTASGFSWSGNTYYGNSSEREFQWTSGTYTFANWKSATGLGSSDSYAGGRPAATRVFVRPNKYERGRANVVIYNWSGQGTVSVDLSNVLTSGDAYEIRNVQNWFGAPVASGTYGGGSVSIPMTAVTPQTPLGGWVTTPPVTGPDFNVFVVMKK